MGDSKYQGQPFFIEGPELRSPRVSGVYIKMCSLHYVAEEPPLVALVYRYLKVYSIYTKYSYVAQIGGLKDN